MEKGKSRSKTTRIASDENKQNPNAQHNIEQQDSKKHLVKPATQPVQHVHHAPSVGQIKAVPKPEANQNVEHMTPEDLPSHQTISPENVQPSQSQHPSQESPQQTSATLTRADMDHPLKKATENIEDDEDDEFTNPTGAVRYRKSEQERKAEAAAAAAAAVLARPRLDRPHWTDREETLTQLLAKFEESSNVYMGFRANHSSQGAVALYRLGAAAGDSTTSKEEAAAAARDAERRVASGKTLLQSLNEDDGALDTAVPNPISMWQWWYSYSRALEPFPTSSIVLTPSTWMCYLGRQDAYPAFLRFFKQEHSRMRQEREQWQRSYAQTLREGQVELPEKGSGRDWENRYAWLSPDRMRSWYTTEKEEGVPKPCSAALCMPPWRRLLREYFPALAPGMIGGAFHGAIQVGWSLPVISQGLRGLKRLATFETKIAPTSGGESKEQELEAKYIGLVDAGVSMLIQGLAWMASTHHLLDPALQSFSSAQRTSNMAKIAADASRRHSEAVALDCGVYESREVRSSSVAAQEEQKRSATSLQQQLQVSSKPTRTNEDDLDVCDKHPELARASFDAACGACLAGFGRIHQSLGLAVNNLPQNGGVAHEPVSAKLNELLDRSNRYPYSQVDAGFLRRAWSVYDDEALRQHINGASLYAVERLIALAYDRDPRGRARGIVEPITTTLIAASLLCKNDFFVLHLITCWFSLRQILHHLDIGEFEKFSGDGLKQSVQNLFSGSSDNTAAGSSTDEASNRRAELSMYRSPFIQVIKVFLQATYLSYVGQGCPAAGSEELQHALQTGLGVFSLVGHSKFDPVKKLQVIPSWRVVTEQMEPLALSDVHRAKLTMVMLLDAAATSVEASSLGALDSDIHSRIDDSLLALQLNETTNYTVNDALEGVHLLGVLCAYARSGPETLGATDPAPRQVRVLDSDDIARAEWLDKLIRLTTLKASSSFRFGQR